MHLGTLRVTEKKVDTKTLSRGETMREGNITKENFSELREQAEEALHGRPAGVLELSEVSLEETHHLIYELRVHQTELEMQNEELCQA